MILNALAAVAVAFFIVMTAWGWFSKADEAALRIVLGALLTTIALFLLIPSTNPKTGARKTLYGALDAGGCWSCWSQLVGKCWHDVMAQTVGRASPGADCRMAVPGRLRRVGGSRLLRRPPSCPTITPASFVTARGETFGRN